MWQVKPGFSKALLGRVYLIAACGLIRKTIADVLDLRFLLTDGTFEGYSILVEQNLITSAVDFSTCLRAAIKQALD